MNEKNQHVSDEQIDALIRSGLWQDEQPLTADEEKLADAAFARAMAKIDRKAKRQKRRTVLHMLDRVVRVAACLIVAVGIAFPIALANSEAFREQILQLVLSINPETGMAHVGMEPAKDEQTANVPRMDVPDGWEGLFFPTFLPDSLPLVRLTGVGRKSCTGSSLPLSFAAPSISTDDTCPSAVRHKPHCTLTADQPGRFNVPCAASES